MGEDYCCFGGGYGGRDYLCDRGRDVDEGFCGDEDEVIRGQVFFGDVRDCFAHCNLRQLLLLTFLLELG